MARGAAQAAWGRVNSGYIVGGRPCAKFRKVVCRMALRAKSSQYIIRILLIIASVALLVMMCVVVGNVIGRIFFKTPIYGTVEIAGLTGVCLIAVAVGFTEREFRNVIVAIVAERFPPRVRGFADAFTLFLSLGVVAILSWAVFDSAIEAAAIGDYTPTLGISPAPFKFAWAIGTAILCLFLIQHIVQAFMKGLKR
jgi:TRAP-type C4-dicarboxylate transport system permease small subunit